MATASKAPPRPAYRQHTAVDDHAGVVVDIDVATGEEHDAARVIERVDAIADTLERPVKRVTADAAYGVARVYAALEARRTYYAALAARRTDYAALAARRADHVMPHRNPVRRRDAAGFPVERFKYDARHDVVRCPARKVLTPRNATRAGRVYRARRRDCDACPLRAHCLPRASRTRRVHVADNHPAMLRARRKRRRWGARERALYTRHRWRVEGAHGTAKTLHGLNRAMRRGIATITIQALLTAVAMNLKKRATALYSLILRLLRAGGAVLTCANT